MCPSGCLGLGAWSTPGSPDLHQGHNVKTHETGSFKTVAFFGREKLSQGHLILECNGL